MSGRGPARGSNPSSSTKGKEGGRRYMGKGFNRGASNTTKPDTKRTVTDYSYHIGTAKHACEFETTTEYLINHIIQECVTYSRDVGQALNDLKHQDMDAWIPSLQVTTDKSDPAMKAALEKQFEIQYAKEYEVYIVRRSTYQQNMAKAYAILWERCAKSMKNKIETRPEFQQSIYMDPIQLLKAIKEYSLNYQDNKYPPSVVFDAIKGLLDTKQREGESLGDYTKRFMSSRDLIETIVKTMILKVVGAQVRQCLSLSNPFV
jgi:hypothetical protein